MKKTTDYGGCMDSATIRMPPLRIMLHKADQNGATMIFDNPSRIAYHHDRRLISILAPDYAY